jgi:hypothetical protein
MSTRKQQKQEARVRPLELEAALRERDRRKRRRSSLAAVAAALLLLGGGAAALAGGSDHTGQAPGVPASELAPLASLGELSPPGSPGALGPEGVPVPDARQLADGGSALAGSTVDGIQCQGTEQVLFHIHAHLTVFVNGAPRRIPYGIGIPGALVSRTPAGPYVATGSCFYWLHTHAADGIIHIESPVQRTYTLGNFFDVWGQPLGPNEVGPVSGPVTALYDGQVFSGNPRDIPLTKHAQIQLEVGRPLVAPARITFPAGL